MKREASKLLDTDRCFVSSSRRLCILHLTLRSKDVHSVTPSSPLASVSLHPGFVLDEPQFHSSGSLRRKPIIRMPSRKN